jgi:Tol biopolymer transport system component
MLRPGDVTFPDRTLVLSFGTGRQQSDEPHRQHGAEPPWSPDGTKIAFISLRDSASAAAVIYTMNADGASPTRLTDNPADTREGDSLGRSEAQPATRRYWLHGITL